eukprot:scaffold56259_cov64-Phaeocystis_antarctica.AAC.6
MDEANLCRPVSPRCQAMMRATHIPPAGAPRRNRLRKQSSTDNEDGRAEVQGALPEVTVGVAVAIQRSWGVQVRMVLSRC